MNLNFGIILSVVSAIFGITGVLFSTVNWVGLNDVKNHTRHSLDQLGQKSQLNKHSFDLALGSYKNITVRLHEKIRKDLDDLIKKGIIHIKEADDIHNKILRIDDALEMFYENLDQRVDSNTKRIRTNEKKLVFLDKHRSSKRSINDTADN